MIDAKLEHLNGVENWILFLCCKNLLERLFEQNFILFNLKLIDDFIEREKFLYRICD